MIDISNGTAPEFLIFKLSFVTDVFILTVELILTRADLQKSGKMGDNLRRYLISLWNKASSVQGIVRYLEGTERMNNDCGDIDAYGTMDEGFTVCWVYRSLARNAKQFP